MDIEGLKKLAEAATECEASIMRSTLGEMAYCAADLDKGIALHCRSRKDAQFYSAANPQTVLALIRELEEARKDAERLRTAGKAALYEMCHTTAPRNSFTDAVDALDDAIDAAREKQ